MSNILDTINNASSKVQNVFDNIKNGLGNQYVKYGLVVMLTMYAGFLGPELPTTLSNLFKIISSLCSVNYINVSKDIFIKYKIL